MACKAADDSIHMSCSGGDSVVTVVVPVMVAMVKMVTHGTA